MLCVYYIYNYTHKYVIIYTIIIHINYIYNYTTYVYRHVHMYYNIHILQHTYV